MSLLSLLALSLAPLAAKPRDSDDVALTRATAKIADLEQAVSDLKVSTEALERSIDRMQAASPPREMTPTQQFAHHLQVQQQMMFAQQYAMQQNQTAQAQAHGMQNYMALGMLNDQRSYEEYICNCTPGRAEVFRRSP